MSIVPRFKEGIPPDLLELYQRNTVEVPVISTSIPTITHLRGIPAPKDWHELQLMYPKLNKTIETAKANNLTPDQTHELIKQAIAHEVLANDKSYSEVAEEFGITNDSIRLYMAYKSHKTNVTTQILTGKTLHKAAEIAYYSDYFNLPEQVIEADPEKFRLLYQNEPEWLRQTKMVKKDPTSWLFTSANAKDALDQRKKSAIKEAVFSDPGLMEYRDFLNNHKGLKVISQISSGMGSTAGKLLQAVSLLDKKIPFLNLDWLEEKGAEIEAMGAYMVEGMEDTYGRQLAEAFGTMSVFVPIGLLIAHLAPPVAVGSLGAWIASALGATAKATTEAIIDARDVYNRVYVATGDKQRAYRAGWVGFLAEAAVTGLIDSITLFNPTIGHVLKRFVMSGIGESVQEVAQNQIQQLVETRHIWDKDDFKSALSTVAVSFPIGGVFGAATGTSVDAIAKRFEKLGLDKESAHKAAQIVAKDGEKAIEVVSEVEEKIGSGELKDTTAQTKGLPKIQEVVEKVQEGEATQEDVAKTIDELEISEEEIDAIGDLADLLQYKGELNQETIKEKLKSYLEDESSVEEELKAIFDLQVFGRTTPEIETMLISRIQQMTKGQLKQRIKNTEDPKQRLKIIEEYLAKEAFRRLTQKIGEIEGVATKALNGEKENIEPRIIHIIKALSNIKKGVKVEESIEIVKRTVKNFNNKNLVDEDGTPIRLNADELLSMVTKPKDQLTYGDVLKYYNKIKHMVKVGEQIGEAKRKQRQAKVDAAMEVTKHGSVLTTKVMDRALSDILKKRGMTWKQLAEALGIPKVKSKKDILRYFKENFKAKHLEEAIEMALNIGEVLGIENILDEVAKVANRLNIKAKHQKGETASWKAFFRNAPSFAIGFHRLADVVANTTTGAKTALHEILTHGPARAFSAYIEAKANRTIELVKDAREAFGKKWAKRMSEKVKIDGFTFTREQLMGIYGINKTRGGRKALIEGEGMSEEVIDKAIAHLTEEEKRFVDEQVAKLQAKHDEMIDKVFERTGRVLPYESYYFRLQRQMLGPDYFKMGMDDLLGLTYEDTLSQTDRQLSVEMNRSDNSPHQRPVNYDFFDVVASTIEMQERIIHLSEAVRLLRDLVNNVEFRNIIGARFGEDMLKMFDVYRDILSTPYKMYQGGTASRIMRKVRHNKVFQILALNVKSIQNQVYSYFLMAPYITVQGFLVGNLHVMLHPVAAYREAREKSEIMRSRTFAFEAQELAEFKKITKGTWGQISEKAFNLGMWPQRAMDIMTTTIIWHSVYNSERLSGVSEQEAIRKADDVIRNTQPMSWVITQNRLMVGEDVLGELGRGMMAFTGQQRQLYNMLRVDVTNAFRRGEYKEAMLNLIGIMLSQAFITYTSFKGMETFWDFLKGFAVKGLTILPLLGRLIDMVIERQYYTSIFFGVQDAIADLYFGAKDIYDGDVIDGFLRLAGAVAVVPNAPLPSVFIKRVRRAIEEEDWTALTGLKRAPIPELK